VKKICSIIAVLAVAGAAHAKNMHKVFGTSDQLIKTAPRVEIYIIDPIPVISVEQVQGEDYIYDYHVMQSVMVKKKQAMDLVKAVLDTSQYLHGLNKKCPFMGKYALHFKKGTRAVTLILSTEPCDKAIIFCPGSVIDKKHIDLVEKSNILAAVAKLLPQQTKI
jgi:hypothetical protein